MMDRGWGSVETNPEFVFPVHICISGIPAITWCQHVLVLNDDIGTVRYAAAQISFVEKGYT